ncbi:glycoside hydrolase family 15 protein [Streptomyces sclerotialus]|uniref:glycoside hydrolase family 15 protein n=1 Tax=Streptomyces sclerotialus TaxID=1957 RepID=UPI000AC812C6
MTRTRKLTAAIGAALALTVGSSLTPQWTPATAAESDEAPGAPGAAPSTARPPADKTGFGTSYGTSGKTWFTLQGGRLGEVYYPTLDTPNVRELGFVITDGKDFAVRADEASRQVTRLSDPQSPTYRTVATDKDGRWRLTTTYVTDPDRSAVQADVEFESLTGRPYQVYALYDPALSNYGADDSGRTEDGALVASDDRTASALVASTGFTATSSGYLGAGDGWTDLLQDRRMDWTYGSASKGNVVQTGRTTLTGLDDRRRTTLALGFGPDATRALKTANTSAGTGFKRVSAAYAAGWHRYLSGLRRPPEALRTERERQAYRVSAMVLAATEDKTHRGAFVASPSMPWSGKEEPDTSGYNAVWARDLYQVGTALIAVGDRAGAERALDYLFEKQQRQDGSFPQKSATDGTPIWTGIQLDQVAFPILLADQLGRTDAKTWSHVKRAADFIVGYAKDGHTAPWSEQERWENQSGYSPATIASEIAGLVTAAKIAKANGDTDSAQRYLDTADAWQRKVKDWTVTHNGPYSTKPYFLQLTKDGNPNTGTTYDVSNGGPADADQRIIVDPSFLELVRLGVLPADDPDVVHSLKVVDEQLGFDTPNGRFWYRGSFDGYGETADGSPWFISQPGDGRTHGRGWPLLNGERGEYDLVADDPAGAREQLAAMARTTNSGYLMAEQVWDDKAPAGFTPGTGTTSATPLAWTHAQYLRLAVNLADGRLTEQPPLVACRYTDRCD